VETAESVKRRIGTADDLLSIVRSMRAMAAANIRQYERAIDSLADYYRAIEMGLHVILRNRPDIAVRAEKAPRNHLIAVVMGSDQGMCGRLNEQVSIFTIQKLRNLSYDNENSTILAMGYRVASALEALGVSVQETLPVPASVSGVTFLVQDMLGIIENYRSKLNIDHVIVFYAKRVSNAVFDPRDALILPVDAEWLGRLRRKDWPCRTLPIYTMDWDRLFSALISQYLFVSLYRAVAESLASENASRLSAMRGAEKNIRDRLDGLNFEYHQLRQMGITEELIEIVAGFEALKIKKTH